MSFDDRHTPEPIGSKFWTPGVVVMFAFIFIGFCFTIARYIGGIGAVTNLDNQHPWGLWIGVDVATGVALAAGGFTTAAIAHVFGKHQFEAVVRPALLTAALGYTFVAIGLSIDVGRSWALPKPLLFWQGNSVLFEVAMCVVIYLHVLWIEFIPIVLERLRGRVNLPGPLSTFNAWIERVLGFADRVLGRTMWFFIIAGVVLSCMHQSGLGSIMLIAPTKLHPLWYTPILPLLFLTSAIAVGYPMVVFETTIATTSLKRAGEMEILAPLTGITRYLLGIYIVLKIGDMVFRETYVYLFDGSVESISFILEMLVMIVPWIMLNSHRLRTNRRTLFIASTSIVLGVALNRCNVYLVGFTPPYALKSYFPSIGEMSITVALICCIMVLYRLAVTYLPVLSAPSLDSVDKEVS
jgi:Ni/Fe-hydrogenase subunit HybB-like protein